MSHRLDPLLRPDSIAVLGATERPGSVGRQTVENLLRGGYPGTLYAINPNYETVCGIKCYPNLAALPAVAEHVILAVGDARIEAVLEEVIAHGAQAATILSALVLEHDSTPDLKQRIAEKIHAANLLVCGGNGMGFYNFRAKIWACGFATRDTHQSGNVAFISHSGSGMAGIVDVDERIDFNLVVSSGQELSVAMDEYLDYALDLPETRVVGLFMETVRNPRQMIAALEKANRKAIPVVALKVGRTEFSARLTVSHSGAIAGDDAAYQALFDRYGVQRVNDMEELATTLIMFAQPLSVAAGGLVAIHDSGGERQLLIDRASDFDVPLAELSAATTSCLENLLDPALPAVNPLDAWGAGGPDADRIMAESFTALIDDPNAALGAVIHDRAPGGAIHTEYLEYLRAGQAASGKPVFLVANRQGTGVDPAVIAATRAGFPVLDGLAAFLRGVKCLFDYRDFTARALEGLPEFPHQGAGQWQGLLCEGRVLDEFESSTFLSELGMPVNPVREAETEVAALSAAGTLGYPVVLKTAAAGIAHKTEHDGVRLNLADEAAFTAAYRDISGRLGPKVLVSHMITGAGIEMMIGMTHDVQFGPLVVFGFGGVNAEVLNDCACVLPPIDAQNVRRLLDRLKMRSLLDGYRGAERIAPDDFCKTVEQFSRIVANVGDAISEIDMNPVIVNAAGCVIVDALVVGKGDDGA
jgi:acyl-CoA synthetase (NDP forming)